MVLKFSGFLSSKNFRRVFLFAALALLQHLQLLATELRRSVRVRTILPKQACSLCSVLQISSHCKSAMNGCVLHTRPLLSCVLCHQCQMLGLTTPPFEKGKLSGTSSASAGWTSIGCPQSATRCYSTRIAAVLCFFSYKVCREYICFTRTGFLTFFWGNVLCFVLPQADSSHRRTNLSKPVHVSAVIPSDAPRLKKNNVLHRTVCVRIALNCVCVRLAPNCMCSR